MQPPLGSLAAHWHACRGQIPPPLVGASATLVDTGPGSGDVGQGKLYLFGGRLVSTRRMVNDLYELDLGTLVWTKLAPSSGSMSSRPSSSSSPSRTSSRNSSVATQPQPRYFHSADLWQGRLVVFGGMGYANPLPAKRTSTSSSGQATSPEPKADELCVLDQIIAFDLSSRTWDLNFGRLGEGAASPQQLQANASVTPAPRYAHLSAVTAGTLIIIGGQNMANQYVEEISVFDFQTRRWVGAHSFPKQCGSYRSLAVAGRSRINPGDHAPLQTRPRARQASVSTNTDTLDNRDRASSVSNSLSSTTSASGKASSNGTGTATTASEPSTPVGGNAVAEPSSAPSHPTLLPRYKLPSSLTPTDNEPLPIYIYSNFNFTSVNRQLGVVTLSRNGKNKADEGIQENGGALNGAAVDEPQAGSHPSSMWGVSVDIEDRSSRMEGPALPPGLRFPTGSILGSYLIISGTYLANTSQTFSIWALHLPTLSWTRLDPGQLLNSGSWNRAILWPRRNQLLVTGHRDRNLVDDYNHRQTNWDHVVLLELEAWGIYQPPVQVLSDAAVELGLEKLAASSQGSWLTSYELGGGSVVHLPSSEDAAGGRSPGAESDGSAQVAKVSLPTAPLSLGGRGDFELLGSDGVRLGCDRTVLEARWPWFQQRLAEWSAQARDKARGRANWMASAAFMPEKAVRDGGVIESKEAEVEWNRRNEALQMLLDGEEGEVREEVSMGDGSEESEEVDNARPGVQRDRRPSHLSSTSDSGVTARGSSRHDARRPSTSTTSYLRDPRLTPRILVMSEPSPVLLALLQFLYTRTLCTPLQRHPAMLASLLVLSVNYGLEELGVWVRHAAHTILGRDLAPPGMPHTPTTAESASDATGSSTVGALQAQQQQPSVQEGASPEERHRLASMLAETAALTGEGPLQLRALRTSMLAAKWAQRVAQSAAVALQGGAGTPGADDAKEGDARSASMGRQPSAALQGSAVLPASERFGQTTYTPGHAHAYQDAQSQSQEPTSSSPSKRRPLTPTGQASSRPLAPPVAPEDQRLRSSSDPRWGGAGPSSVRPGDATDRGVSSTDEDDDESSSSPYPSTSSVNARRPSNKAERMLGLSGAEAAAAGLGASTEETGRSRAPPVSGRGTVGRRLQGGSANASPLPSQPPSAASSRGTSPSVPRKRFSIFGRGAAPPGAPSGATALANEIGSLSVHDDEGAEDAGSAARNTPASTPNGHSADTAQQTQTQTQMQIQRQEQPKSHGPASPIARGTVASKIQALQQQVAAANGAGGAGSNGLTSPSAIRTARLAQGGNVGTAAEAAQGS